MNPPPVQLGTTEPDLLSARSADNGRRSERRPDMSKTLPPQPNMEFLRKEAKDLLDARRRGDRSVIPVMRNLRRLRGSSDATLMEPSAVFSLQDAQLCLAIEYGFESWAALKARVEGSPPPPEAPRFHDVEELADLPDRTLQMMMRDLDNADLSRIVASGSPRLRERLLENVTDRHRARLETALSDSDPAKTQESRDHALWVANTLLEMGEISREAREDLTRSGRERREAQNRAARDRFVERVGAKPSSQRTNAELVSVLRALAEISRRDGLLSLDGITAEFLDEELLKRGAEMMLDGEDVEWVRRKLELKRSALLEEFRRRTDVIVEGIMRISCGDNPEVVEDACRKFA